MAVTNIDRKNSFCLPGSLRLVGLLGGGGVGGVAGVVVVGGGGLAWPQHYSTFPLVIQYYWLLH